MSAKSAVEHDARPQEPEQHHRVARASATPGVRGRSTRGSDSKRAPRRTSPRRNTRASDFPTGRTTTTTSRTRWKVSSYPATYAAAKGMKPEDVLKKMVARAKAKYDASTWRPRPRNSSWTTRWRSSRWRASSRPRARPATTSARWRRSSTTASSRQHRDHGALQFDSTFNYLKDKSNIDISETEINSNKDPYNTYTQQGTAARPDRKPGRRRHEGGAQSDRRRLDTTSWRPTAWNKTEFAKTHAEFQKLKEKFNARSGN